jgi:hypothetical protein
MKESSFFKELYSDNDFNDRFIGSNEYAVDVIIPIKNTNELWEKNLHCFYNEIPINRLLIGDAGSNDNSIDIVKKFPRVYIFDQSKYETLGFCLKKLIEEVETTWFVYLHSDVYLPSGWFDVMISNQKSFDWFECMRRMTILVDFPLHTQNRNDRSYSGSQMGKKSVFEEILPIIQDDYLYRNEDIIFSELIKQKGYRFGKVQDTYHHHQLMNKQGEKEPKFDNVIIRREKDHIWELETYRKQIMGIVKYLKPNPRLIHYIRNALYQIEKKDKKLARTIEKWINQHTPEWSDHIFYEGPFIIDIFKKIINILNYILNIFKRKNLD